MRWATWPVAALTLLVVVATGAIVYAVQHERGVKPTSFTDAVKNQQIIDRLTPYPGSRQTRKFVRRSYGGSGQGLLPGLEVRSHSTEIVYSMPPDTKPKRIADFYVRQLRGWERTPDPGFAHFCGTSGIGGPCFAQFTKGDAMVTINLDRGLFFLVVDAHGAYGYSSSGG